MENFKIVVIDRWRGKLCEKATQDMEQYYARPLLETGLNSLVKCAKNTINKSYRSRKEHQYRRKYKKLKKKYRKKMRSLKQQRGRRDKASLAQTKNKIREQYHTSLLKLQQKTRDPKLIAAIVRRGGPMDLTCVKAVAKMLPGGVVFNIKCENVENKTICSDSSDSSSPVINLELRGNHYYLCDSNSTANTTAPSDSYRNDCLYEGLCRDFPDLAIGGADQFRKNVANCIEKDRDIRYHIQNGWHSYLFDQNAYGGRLFGKPTGRADLGETSERDLMPTDKHIECRMSDMATVVGVGQRISEENKVPYEKLVVPGPSKLQDARSGRGKDGIDAAHVNRFNTDEDVKIEQVDRKELRGLSSHTQLTVIAANRGGIGRDCDKLQEEYLPKFRNFNVFNPTEDDRFLVKCYYEECNKILSAPRNRRHGVRPFNDINVEVGKFFETAQRGYSGEYRQYFIPINTPKKSSRNP